MITLIHDLVIDVDTNGYTVMLDKYKINDKGKPVYDKLGYYATLTSAMHGAREYSIRKQLEAGTHTLTEALNVVRSTTKEFSELLKAVRSDA